MKQKGFTLAELLGVIVILGLLALIVIPVVTESINGYRIRICEVQVKDVLEAARVWGAEEENIMKLPQDEIETRTITLAELQEGGYIDKNIKNPLNKNEYLEMDITIRRQGYKFKYTTNFDCGGN